MPRNAFWQPFVRSTGTVLVLLGLVQDTGAQSAILEVRTLPESVEIELRIANSLDGPPEHDNRELVLRFAQPLIPLPLEVLSQQVPAWIEGASAGYDSILIRSAREVSFEVHKEPGGLRITLKPRVKVVPAADESGHLRLSLLSAQIESIEGKWPAALDALRRLNTQFPSAPQVLSGLAEAEHRAGRSAIAERFYREARNAAPFNEDIVAGHERIRWETAPLVSAEAAFRSFDIYRSERQMSVNGRVPLTASTALLTSFDAVRYRSALLGNGTRTRGKLVLRHDVRENVRIQTGVAAGGGAGIEALIEQTGERGQTRLEVSVRQPFWEFPEQLRDGGSRSRIELARSLQVSSRVGARIAVHRSGYRTEVQPAGVVHTAGLQGSASVLLMRAPVSLSAEYFFDGEYRNGGLSAALPFTSREVHAAGPSMYFSPVRNTAITMSGGFAVDRLGGHGPYLAGRVSREISSALQIEAWFDRRLSSVGTGQTVQLVGFRLARRF